MKYFPKKLLEHEIFRSMVSWATKYFLKNLVKPSGPSSYVLNVRSLTFKKTNSKNIEEHCFVILDTEMGYMTR